MADIIEIGKTTLTERSRYSIKKHATVKNGKAEIKAKWLKRARRNDR
jgi:hypothetical protein